MGSLLATMPDSSMHARDLSLGPRACVLSTLPSELSFSHQTAVIFLKIYFYLWICHKSADACRSRRIGGGQVSLELKLEAVISYLMWVLGMELWSS